MLVVWLAATVNGCNEVLQWVCTQFVFRDKMGKLALSPKQHGKFSRWARPEDFIDNPQMILAVSSFSIKQVHNTAPFHKSIGC